MSHNPFRKARDQQVKVVPSDSIAAAGLFNVQTTAQDGFPSASPVTDLDKSVPAEAVESKSVKKKKKVVIKTPPRSPEETQRRFSSGISESLRPQFVLPVSQVNGEELERYGQVVDEGQQEYAQQSVIPRTDGNNTYPNDPSTYGSSTDSAAVGRTPLTNGTSTMTPVAGKAPFNPFARTLASSEQEYGMQQKDEVHNDRPKAFDVDIFKNILLHGAAPPVTTKIATQAQIQAQAAHDEASTAFEEKYPAFEAVTAQQDSPNSAAQDALQDETVAQGPSIIEDDEVSEEESDIEIVTAAVQPSKPQTVAFDDFSSSATSTFDSLPANTEKALPILPTEAKAMPPPPPPAARRQAPGALASTRRRSSSVMSKSSVQSDASSILPHPSPAPESTSRAPPPPPSRRTTPARAATTASEQDVVTSPTVEKPGSVPPPAPAPRRTPNKTSQIEARSPSNASRSSLPGRTDSGSSIVPPRPPPRRAGESNRSSVDGSASFRRSSAQESEPAVPQSPSPSKADLLSDLAALQREVDELRAKAAAG